MKAFSILVDNDKSNETDMVQSKEIKLKVQGFIYATFTIICTYFCPSKANVLFVQILNTLENQMFFVSKAATGDVQ